MDKIELDKEIEKVVRESISMDCLKGNHNFVPLKDGTLDVICTRCGVKAMRAVMRY